MKQIEINKRYYNNNQLKYVKVPFILDSEVDHIEIEYDYQRFDENADEINIIDIGLFDCENNFRGWSGSNKTSLFISEFYSTPGYQKVKLEKGTWYIALGLYKITDYVDIKILIKIYLKKYKWYSSDLHMHTVNSDGDYRTSEVIKYCKKQKIDCIALTDHNNTVQNRESISDKDLSIIHGMEYTNYRGHANFYFTKGKTDFLLDPLTNSFDEMKELFISMKKQGCVISLNHIFDTYCPWLFGFENFPYDVIEIWNGFMTEDNMKAVKWWHSYISKGNKLPIIGGSDTHKMLPLRTYGLPTTFIYSDSKTPDSLLNSIKNGNCTVSYYLDGPIIDFTIEEVIVGESIKFKDNLKGKLVIKNVKRGQEIHLISEKQVEMKWTTKDSIEFNETFDVQKRLFYRVEVYHKIEDKVILAAISNPIYIMV